MALPFHMKMRNKIIVANPYSLYSDPAYPNRIRIRILRLRMPQIETLKISDLLLGKKNTHNMKENKTLKEVLIDLFYKIKIQCYHPGPDSASN
jgi:hypothetical protein